MTALGARAHQPSLCPQEGVLASPRGGAGRRGRAGRRGANCGAWVLGRAAAAAGTAHSDELTTTKSGAVHLEALRRGTPEAESSNGDRISYTVYTTF